MLRSRVDGAPKPVVYSKGADVWIGLWFAQRVGLLPIGLKSQSYLTQTQHSPLPKKVKAGLKYPDYPQPPLLVQFHSLLLDLFKLHTAEWPFFTSFWTVS